MFILIKLSFNLKDNLQHAKKSCIKRLSENGMHCCRKVMPTSEVLRHVLACAGSINGCAQQKLQVKSSGVNTFIEFWLHCTKENSSG